MPTTQPDFVPLTNLPRVLRDRYQADPPPTYRRVRRLILNGLVDAELTASNRYLIREADLPKVAALLGLGSASP